MPCIHHWMVGQPTFTRQDDVIIEHTEQRCKFCFAHKDNRVVAVTLPPDVVNYLNLPIEVMRGEVDRVLPPYIHWKTGKLTKARAA